MVLLYQTLRKKPLALTNFFAGYCTTFENDSEIPPTSTPLTNNILGDIDVRLADIGTIIDSLNPKKAHGIDGISIELIKKCKNELAKPLKIIFDKCLASGTYPSLWKKSKRAASAQKRKQANCK